MSMETENIYEYEQRGLPGFEHKTGAWVSIKTFAGIYDVTEQSIRDWIKEGIISAQKGQVDVNQAIRDVYRHQRSLIEGKKGSAAGRYHHAKAELMELELQKRKGDLVEVQEIGRELFKLARQARDAFENIPSRISALLAAERDEHKIKDLLSKEIRQILWDLSEGSKKLTESKEAKKDV